MAGIVLAVAGLAVVIAGCGGGDASGATVSVYVGAPLCSAAKASLAAHGEEAGSFKVAVRCLTGVEKPGGGTDLATVGANSRRATEDTTSVVTLEPPGPANKFSRPILESAGIPLLVSASARQGMSHIIEAIEDAGTSNVRHSVEASLTSN